jgi:hypothetical protein
VERTVKTIAADWRAAADERVGTTFDPDLEARIEVLRLEHTAALEDRRWEIQETLDRRSRVH